MMGQNRFNSVHTQRNSLKVFFTVFFGTYQVTIVLQVAVLQFVIFILVLIWGEIFLSLLNRYITGFCMRSMCYINQCVKEMLLNVQQWCTLLKWFRYLPCGSAQVLDMHSDNTALTLP